ncbi:TlpA family protein disulfide reductase [Ramlibacter terrae]|uniref:TlpA family protein disulfide reductase n=1 Tax=Ramlibacter terrae TaxID=2732511 RepID=A0ABX6P8E2_9BURK|nr:TlpA family protein disulfide reductase [Ramlibacter terrae]
MPASWRARCSRCRPGGGAGVTTSRRLVLHAAAATGVALALPARAAEIVQAPAGGRLAGFNAPDLQGAASPIPATGKPTVVNFWATWCPPCRAEMPLLLQMADLYGDKFVLQLVNFKERASTVQRYMQASAGRTRCCSMPLAPARPRGR